MRTLTLTLALAATLLSLSACGDDSTAPADTTPVVVNQSPVVIDPATGCPEGMPRYKCEQINGNSSEPAQPPIKD